MSKKRQDDILNAAFDGTISEIQGLTSEEQAEAQSFAEIKTALKSLKDVPECQLSNERLRNAILDQGVVQRRPFAWTFTMATAACAVISVLFAVQMGTSEQGDKPQLTARQDGAIFVQPKRDEPVRVAMNEEPKSLTEQPIKVERPRTAARQKKNRPTVQPVASASESAEPALMSAVLDARPQQQEPGVVIVEAGLTAENGASPAVELEAHSDVVIGG